MEEALNAADAARAWGQRWCWSPAWYAEMPPPGTIDMVAVDADGAWLVSTPRLPRTFTGGRRHHSRDLSGHCVAGLEAAENSRAYRGRHLWGSEDHERPGRTELALIYAQDELIRPSQHFEPVRVR